MIPSMSENTHLCIQRIVPSSTEELAKASSVAWNASHMATTLILEWILAGKPSGHFHITIDFIRDCRNNESNH